MPRTKSGPKGRTNRSLRGTPAKIQPPAPPDFFTEAQRTRFNRIAGQLGERFRPGMEYSIESLVIALTIRDDAAKRICAEGVLVGDQPHPGEMMLARYEKRVSELLRDLSLIRRERSDRVKDEPLTVKPEKPKLDPLQAGLEEQIG